ncbi:hypothetical protein CF327_g882 [Tilletia walkeri]|nr:hypothetical protein CF327_g882 [Tilletia walkeri]
MLRPSASCPALKDAVAFKTGVEGGTSSPARSADPRAAASAARRNKMPKQQDFPVPPKTVEIAFEFQSSPQQYDREGADDDASPALLGTGAFGAAYRYVKATPSLSISDESPASTTSTQASRYPGSQHPDYSSPPSSMEEEILEDGFGSAVALNNRRRPGTGSSKNRDPATRGDAKEVDDTNAADGGTVGANGGGKLSAPVAARVRSGSVLRSAASLPQLKQHARAQEALLKSGAPAGSSRTANDKRLSSIVIKLCRTPISGSFDELPRHSRNAATKPTVNWHVRIVRGEGRMFRYLQKVQALHVSRQRRDPDSDSVSSKKAASSSPNKISDDDTNIVRLFADLPADGQLQGQIFDLTPVSSVANSMCVMSNAGKIQDMDSHSRPLYRMLVFEELVDLDAEFVDGAWVKGTQQWTAVQVENAARDTALGLRFLHAHGIVHSDLKPANLMRDPRTNAVKLIDLGAARRFVRIEDQFKHSTTIVEERDAAMNSAEEEAAMLKNTRCDGLTSLTGSPHFMAPEILLQATRYTDKEGQSRSTLKDYKRNPHYLPASSNVQWLRLCLDDYAVGWGVKADIWSWGCCVLSFLVRMLAPFKDRNNTALICPFDFTFDDGSDALHPLHELATPEKNLPHFHLWARIYPLRIQDIVAEGARITAKAQECMSPSLTRMVIASLRHHTVRPTAEHICDALLPPRTRPTNRQNRHSMSDIDRTLINASPATLQDELHTSASSSTNMHAIPVPATMQAPVVPPSQVAGVAGIKSEQPRTPGLSPAVELKENDPNHHQVELKELPANAEREGRRRFTFSGNKRPQQQQQTTAPQVPVTPKKDPQHGAELSRIQSPGDAQLSARQSRMSGGDPKTLLAAPGLGLQLGSPASMVPPSPNPARKGGSSKETLATPLTGTDKMLSELITPPETPQEPIVEKMSALRRRLSKVSNVNLRMSNVMAAMHLSGSRERGDSTGKQSQRHSGSTRSSYTGGKSTSGKSTVGSQGERGRLEEPISPSLMEALGPMNRDPFASSTSSIPPPPPAVRQSARSIGLPVRTPQQGTTNLAADGTDGPTESLQSSPASAMVELGESPSAGQPSFNRAYAPSMKTFSSLSGTESRTPLSSTGNLQGSPRPNRSQIVASPPGVDFLTPGDANSKARQRTLSGLTLGGIGSFVRRAMTGVAPNQAMMGGAPNQQRTSIGGRLTPTKAHTKPYPSGSASSSTSSFGTSTPQSPEASSSQRRASASGRSRASSNRERKSGQGVMGSVERSPTGLEEKRNSLRRMSSMFHRRSGTGDKPLPTPEMNVITAPFKAVLPPSRSSSPSPSGRTTPGFLGHGLGLGIQIDQQPTGTSTPAPVNRMRNIPSMSQLAQRYVSGNSQTNTTPPAAPPSQQQDTTHKLPQGKTLRGKISRMFQRPTEPAGVDDQ